MSSRASTTAVLAAMAANAGIAVAKFVGFLFTGSSSMLAEGLHSVADTSNQLLLMFGQRQARKDPDALHPFGYGRSRYFYAFLVAVVLFTLGSVFSFYEGYRKISHRHDVSDPWVALVILLVAGCLEGFSLHTARQQSQQVKGSGSWWEFIRNSRNAELPIVLLEDTAALIGLVLAFSGVFFSALTGDPIWDGIATMGIAVLLAVIAVVLMIETKSLLIGEGATKEQLSVIRDALLHSSHVKQLLHVRTQYLSPDELLVTAKVAVAPELPSSTMTHVINEAQARVRAVVPAARVIYIEPDSADAAHDSGGHP
ncbi:cation diffusion facilitator family transporter [Mycobacterium sp. OAS707]|uniref:cation diffusion facilitator family transporter n=1 Tax=Mycobacterium sp. OAS707 TaxID=2663822 RepID=UPI001789F531|nr:cation diffusion facilitator family transporter [Mycobacterium sp. OAS707]MBE1552173.1 cation diffusion facilitator family transporter [Mycobacterium sp. OAS707]